jgi:hypothetical protein
MACGDQGYAAGMHQASDARRVPFTISGAMVLTYAPWVAREGMAGTFAHLVEAWGSPDAWANAAVREQVCERGQPVPVRWDAYTPLNATIPCVMDAPEHPNFREQFQRMGDETT